MIRIKICGVRSADEAVMLSEAGADAVGVIVGTSAKCEHQVPIEKAAAIFRTMEELAAMRVPRARRVLVTHEKHPEALLKYLRCCRSPGKKGSVGKTYVEELQLHGDFSDDEYEQLYRRFRKECIPVDLVRTIHIRPDTNVRTIRRSINNTRGAIAVLLDTATLDRLGGTGLTHDWGVSSEICRTSGLPVVLAGGLTPDNVYPAVLSVRPDGIDVNTGTRERCLRDLNQSPARVAKLVEGVRRAERHIAERILSDIAAGVKGGGRIVFFVGAGASATSGIPVGDSLRDNLLRQFYPDLSSDDEALHRFRLDFQVEQDRDIPLELPISFFRKIAPPQTIRHLFRGDFEGRTPSVTHHALADIGCHYPNAGTVTVNQDDLFEKALSSLRPHAPRVPGLHVTEREWALYKAGDFLKIHGELARPETIAMSVDETRKLPPWKKNRLADLLGNSTVFFVGYSFRDEDILKLLTDISVQVYCIDPFVSPSFRLRRVLSDKSLATPPVPVSAERAFAAISRHMPDGYRAVLWSASDGTIVGHSRNHHDEWNFQTSSTLWRKCRIIGSSPGSDATRDWNGGEIRFRYEAEDGPIEGLRNASIAVHIPPGEGKGIHGAENATVQVRLTTNREKDIPAAQFVCNRIGNFQNHYAHTSGDRAPRAIVAPEALAALRKARWFEMALKVPDRCCMDIHELCLHVNDNWA